MTLARRNGVALPYESADALRAIYRFDNLQAFLDLYYLGLTVLQTFEDFREMTAAYLERAAADNVRHAEVFISPQAHERRGLPLALFVEAILAAFDEAAGKHGITGGVILGLQRQFPEDDAFRMLREAKPYRDKVFGLGMGGPELGNRPGKFTRVFAEARGAGWRTVAHAGEEGGADYVREAVEALKVDRIDHGVHCEDDGDLMRLLADRGMPLTVCPLSNVMLRVFPDMKSHNLKRLYDAGLCVDDQFRRPALFRRIRQRQLCGRPGRARAHRQGSGANGEEQLHGVLRAARRASQVHCRARCLLRGTAIGLVTLISRRPVGIGSG